MCADIEFYRPRLGKPHAYAVWRSHREIARHALQRGHKRILVLEDDVKLPARWAEALRRAREKLRHLPEDWWGFYLGHRPLQAYFVSPGILRTRSMYAHAYVANEPLLHWLAESEPMDPCIPMALEHGHAIDTAMSNLPSMYALWPMTATQRPLGHNRVDVLHDENGRRRSLFDLARYEYFGRHYGMRLFEASATLVSPWSRRTLEATRLCSGAAFAQEAKLTERLFNGEFYLERYPDVARAGLGALFHYLIAGSDHDHRPHPLFDPAFYREQYPDVAASGLKPLAHFLTIGTQQGRTPHALFDAAWYRETYRTELRDVSDLFHHFLHEGAQAGFNPNRFFDTVWYRARYPEVPASGLNPLEHYAWRGTALSPSPQFDGPQYLAAHPDVVAAGMNPLEHYLKYGRSEGRKIEAA